MKAKHLIPCFLWLAGLSMSAQSPYVIYPVPQSQEAMPGTATFTNEAVIVVEPGIDDVTVARAKQVLADRGIKASVASEVAKGKTNIVLGVKGSGNLADKEAARQSLKQDIFTLPKYDKHIVSLTADNDGTGQLLIQGENTDAVFYGLASLEQMLDNGLSNLPCVVIYDYADQGSRGVIEGYYGVPYNADVTKDLFRFMSRYKMNTYMYGAKSDPYHTRFWDVPYPDSISAEQEAIGYLTQEMLRDIVNTAHDSKVNFIWAIHPGNAFVNAEATDVNERIMNKFQNMYDLGVRQFGVFVDDVGVPYDRPTQMLGANRLTELQGLIDERWNSDANASPADTVKPLQYVPQLYAYSWTQPEKAQGFFESLSGTPDKVDIYITGANVWSVPNSRDLDLVSGWLGRDVAWWWNYPCNDNDMTKIFPMDMYSNFHDETHISNKARMEGDLKGARTLIANPMQQGEASKIALFSMGDYAWNNDGFENMASWEASLPAVVGKEKAADLKTLLPYMRYYDEDILGVPVENYKKSVEQGTPESYALLAQLTEALAACKSIQELQSSESESNRLFYEDIRPWLNKLEAMFSMTIDLLNGKDVSGYPDLENADDFQFAVLNGMGDEISLSMRVAEPAAQVLQPFIGWLKEQP